MKTVSDDRTANHKEYLRAHPEVSQENINEFRHEMSFLGEKPILVAMGRHVYKVLSTYLQGEFEIKQIMHYSAMIGKEEYRRDVLEKLGL